MWGRARDFKHHDDSFSEQYARRLKLLEDHGILDIQMSFWKLEAQCRKVIGDAVLGLRLVPPDPPVSVAGDASRTLGTKPKSAGIKIPEGDDLRNMSDEDLEKLAAELDAAGIDGTMFSLTDIPPTGDPGKCTNSS